MDRMIDTLKRIEDALEAKKLPSRAATWSSCGVVIAPSRASVNFPPRSPYEVFVFTKHSPQLTWCFEELVKAFCGPTAGREPEDSFSRRLALAAKTCQRRFRNPGARRLCTAVWHEAYAIYDEKRLGCVRYPAPDVTNLIDPALESAIESGFIGPVATQRFAARMRGDGK